VRIKKILLLCRTGKNYGIGHLSRVLRVSKYFQDKNIAFKILIVGPEIDRNELDKYQYTFYPETSNISDILLEEVREKYYDLIIFDFNPGEENFSKTLDEIRGLNIKLIAIDSFFSYCQKFELIWSPSFIKPIVKEECVDKIKFGWDKYFLNKIEHTKEWKPGNSILVLTGGSDVKNLIQILPKLLIKNFPNHTIKYVVGPYTKKPKLDFLNETNFQFVTAPQSLDSLIAESNYIVTNYGISFYECVYQNKPSCLLVSDTDICADELNMLNQLEITLVTKSIDLLISQLNKLITNDNLSLKLSNKTKNLLKDGSEKFVNKAIEILER